MKSMRKIPQPTRDSVVFYNTINPTIFKSLSHLRTESKRLQGAGNMTLILEGDYKLSISQIGGFIAQNHKHDGLVVKILDTLQKTGTIPKQKTINYPIKNPLIHKTDRGYYLVDVGFNTPEQSKIFH